MTDDELQTFANQEVRLTYCGRVLSGKLIAGFEAQVSVKAPYAIEWSTGEPNAANYEVHRAAIMQPEAVETVELLNGPAQVAGEIDDAVDDAQTPG